MIFIVSSTSSKLSSFVDKEIFAEVLPGFIVTDCDKALKSVPEIAVPELEATSKLTTFSVTADNSKLKLTEPPSSTSVNVVFNNGALSLSITVMGI